MPTRTSAVTAADRRATYQLDELVRELRAARLAAGLSQAAVSGATGCSRQLIGFLEGRRLDPDLRLLARWAAVVGRDVSVRAFPAGTPLRDAGQLRLLARFRGAMGDAWRWRTEVPVVADPRDRRAFDAVLARPPYRIAVEAVVRLTDAQLQVRNAGLKQAAARIDRIVLVLADTRHNRLAVHAAAPTLVPAFPLSSRETLRSLRLGELPRANGVVLV